MAADNFVGQPTAGERALKPHFRKIRVKNGEFAGEPRMTAEIMEGETAMCAAKMLINISDARSLARSDVRARCCEALINAFMAKRK